MDKIDKLLDTIEHPERYSDAEMKMMLADPEVKRVYEMLDKTKASLTPISTPNVDAEWESFRNAHGNIQTTGKFNIFNLLSHKVAASIAIGIASLAAVAAVVGVSVNYAINKKTGDIVEVVPTAKENIISSDTIVVIEEAPDEAPETIAFDNEPLETIIHRIAQFYGYTAEFSTDAPKSLRLYFRWNQALPLDEIVERLNNFEQINLTVKDKTIKIE